MVDVSSEYYQIARRYMLRLNVDDFNDPHELAKFADTCKLHIDEFRDKFYYIIENDLTNHTRQTISTRLTEVMKTDREAMAVKQAKEPRDFHEKSPKKQKI
jgi:hypothetical protein